MLDQELQGEHRLTLAEYEVLAIISDAGEGGLRMQELAETLHLSPSGVTRRVDGMVRRGLVVRRQCSEDRRRSYAMLTDDGWNRLREAAPTHVRGVRAHFVDRLTERQLANVANALSSVSIDLEAAARRLRRGVTPSTRFSGAAGSVPRDQPSYASRAELLVVQVPVGDVVDVMPCRLRAPRAPGTGSRGSRSSRRRRRETHECGP